MSSSTTEIYQSARREKDHVFSAFECITVNLRLHIIFRFTISFEPFSINLTIEVSWK